jgi:tripartite-type tricarboxylate transporter receptor subunit TctC
LRTIAFASFTRPVFFILLLVCAASPVAAQQNYPNRPVRMIVPYPAGGANDNFARPVAKKLSEVFGQQFVVDNRPGASGVIGVSLVKQAAPDGYTLLVTSGSLYLIPLTLKDAPWDPIKDLTPIVAAVTSTTVIVTHPSVPAQNVKALVEYGKKNSGQLKYVTAGAGRLQHLTGVSLAHALGVPLTQVSYKGGAQALTDLLGGHVNMGILHLSTVLPHINSGKLRGIAVVEARRSKAYPELPTVAESGYPNYSMPEPFLGIAGPAKLPAAIVNRINAALNKALTEADLKHALESAGYTVTAGHSPAYFNELAANAYGTYKRLVQETGLVFN